MTDSHAVRLNAWAERVYQRGLQEMDALRVRPHHVGAATVVDAGVDASGGLAAGIWLADLCMAGRSTVAVHPSSIGPSPWEVSVHTDHPIEACLASQYAGWPVSAGNFFAMGSGPMRLARGREPMLEQLDLIGTAESLTQPLVGVLECELIPDVDTIDAIADQCDVPASALRMAVAPSYSIAGTVQVVARSVETAMHKLHALDFDVSTISTALGRAPLPSTAARGDAMGGIGRTNDAILYGGVVSFWIDADDDAIESVIERVPSCSSQDFGRPFAEIFAAYDHDFYKVDPMLFSPARVEIQSLKTGHTFVAGQVQPDLLRASIA